MNNDIFYMNRIIKIISPFTFQTFKIELNGEEDELRDLLATILEINPNSIKGLRDSYNNYYTLSSAVKNLHINTNPNNYYTVVIKGANYLNIYKESPKIKSISPYNYKLLKNNRIYTLPNENKINYHTNFLNNTYNFFEDNNNLNQENISMNNYNYSYNDMNKKNDISEYLSFAEDLHKKNYIDNNLIKKLKRLIIERNEEVLSIMSPYIILKTPKSYNEFAKKIIPIISHRSQLSESKEDSNFNLPQNEDILKDIKQNVSKKEYIKLKKLLKNKDKNLLKIINNYQISKNFDKLLSKLKQIVNIKDEEENEINEKTNEKDKSKNKNKLKDKDIKQIEKNIIKALKDKKSFDIYFIAKYDLQTLNKEKKISLFKDKFKLKLDSIINKENYKIPKKNISTIKNYYAEYINKKIKKNYDEKENIIYEGLLEQDEENNFIIQYYKDLLKHKNINQLKEQIKQIIERVKEEDGEEEEEEDDEEEEEEKKVEKNNEGKTSIREEDEEEEEEEDEEGEEEEDSRESKNSKNKENKSSSKNTSDKIIILNGDNKDRGVNLLNNNYRKINNYNFNKNKDNEEKNKDKSKEEKNEKSGNNEKKGDDQNLGLGFVVIKPKKSNVEEENDNILKLNTTESNQNESSLSTNNPNKKLNQFIQQIGHLKKIDNIKQTILEAIKNNNKYIMDLFEKFQKNKFCLNPKSLNEVYTKIKENPEENKNDSKFKSLIKEIPSLSENIKEFLCDEFINNKNSELETYYNLYEDSKEKEEFIESIEMFMKKPATIKILNKFNIKNIKKEIESKLLENKGNLIEKSKEVINIFKKFNLFNEKELNIIKNSIENGDDVYTSAFQVLFDNKDFDEFYETITIALEKHKNKGGNKK